MGRRALECLDISWAKKAYRQAPAAGMVMYLDRIQTVEDKLLLSGHVSALFGDFAKARGRFMGICDRFPAAQSPAAGWLELSMGKPTNKP